MARWRASVIHFNVVVEVVSQTGWCSLRSELLVGHRWLEGKGVQAGGWKENGRKVVESVLGALLGGDVYMQKPEILS